MALNNILKARDQQRNSLGQPLAGGEVFLHEPGTGTFIASYRDSGLVSTHSNPVKLSGSGRANIWITRDCDLTIKDRNGNLILQELKANPDALGLSESGGLVPNGSMEIDADANTIPDGYTLVNETGATNAIDTSESTDGGQSFRFTSTGVGGGSLTTTDFFPVNDVDLLRVNVDLRSTVAAVRNIVRVEWYDASTVLISNSDIYDSTANPTVFTTQNLTATPPALARFAKLRLIGIDPSVALAGSTFFDHLSVFYPVILAGVFDNITIQNNEIISTNVNGAINLQPNGTGPVTIQHTATNVFVSTAVGADFTSPAGSDVVVDAIAPATRAAKYGVRADAGGIRLRALTGGQCGLLQTTAAGAIEDAWIRFDRNAGVNLFHNNINILQTTPAGIDITGPAAATAIADLIAGVGQAGLYGIRTDNSGIRIRNVFGGTCSIEQTTGAGGLEDTWVQFDRNGAVRLFFNNLDILRTTSNGADIIGPASVSTVFDLVAATGQAANYGARADSGGIRLRALTGGQCSLLQTSAIGGIEDTWIEFNRDGAVDLFFNGLEVARTKTALTGGLEVNNQLTGSGFGRVLTTADFTLATEIVTTSGTSHDFTGIPSGVKRIVAIATVVSSNGTDGLQIQLGDSGGFETTGYINTVSDGASVSLNTDAFGFTVGSIAAADTTTGKIILELSNATNTWIATILSIDTGVPTIHHGAGSKTLSGELTQIRFKLSGANTFDAGAVNILYE